MALSLVIPTPPKLTSLCPLLPQSSSVESIYCHFGTVHPFPSTILLSSTLSQQPELTLSPLACGSTILYFPSRFLKPLSTEPPPHIYHLIFTFFPGIISFYILLSTCVFLFSLTTVLPPQTPSPNPEAASPVFFVPTFRLFFSNSSTLSSFYLAAFGDSEPYPPVKHHKNFYSEA